MKPKLPKKINYEKECDKLWALIIKLRARNCSEFSGIMGLLNAHHIAGKSCYALRYSEENGICLTEQEHLNGVHGPNPEKYIEKIKELRGPDIFERMKELEKDTSKVNLAIVYERLQGRAKTLKEFVKRGNC